MKLFKLILACFLFTGAGFLFGAYPDYFKKLITRKDYDYLLFVEEKKFFSDNLQIWIYERTGLRVRVDTQAKAQADLLFLRLDQAKELSAELAPLKDNPDLSADFCSQQFRCDILLPLLWKSEGKNLTIYALASRKEDWRIFQIAQELLSISVQKMWITETGFSGTSKKIETLDIDPQLKPSSFRNLSLKN